MRDKGHSTYCTFLATTLPLHTPLLKKERQRQGSQQRRNKEVTTKEFFPIFVLHVSAFSGVNILNENEFKILELEKCFCPVLPFKLGNSSIPQKTSKRRSYFPYDDEEEEDNNSNNNDNDG